MSEVGSAAKRARYDGNFQSFGAQQYPQYQGQPYHGVNGTPILGPNNWVDRFPPR